MYRPTLTLNCALCSPNARRDALRKERKKREVLRQEVQGTGGTGLASAQIFDGEGAPPGASQGAAQGATQAAGASTGTGAAAAGAAGGEAAAGAAGSATAAAAAAGVPAQALDQAAVLMGSAYPGERAVVRLTLNGYNWAKMVRARLLHYMICRYVGGWCGCVWSVCGVVCGPSVCDGASARRGGEGACFGIGGLGGSLAAALDDLPLHWWVALALLATKHRA